MKFDNNDNSPKPPTGEKKVWTPIDPGEYEFVIEEAIDKPSRAGNDMLTLNIAIKRDGKKDWHVTDYITAKSPHHKIVHLCRLAGIDPATGELTDQNVLGLAGTCKVGIKIDKTGAYADRNEIQDYLAPAGTHQDAPRTRSGDPDVSGDGSDDALPF